MTAKGRYKSQIKVLFFAMCTCNCLILVPVQSRLCFCVCQKLEDSKGRDYKSDNKEGIKKLPTLPCNLCPRSKYRFSVSRKKSVKPNSKEMQLQGLISDWENPVFCLTTPPRCWRLSPCMVEKCRRQNFHLSRRVPTYNFMVSVISQSRVVTNNREIKASDVASHLAKSMIPYFHCRHVHHNWKYREANLATSSSEDLRIICPINSNKTTRIKTRPYTRCH